MTYLGVKGYRPVVATLRENGVVIAYEYREGNDTGGRVDIVKKAFGKMPEEWKTKTIKSIRWLLVEVGDELIAHGRRMIVKIAASADKYRIYLKMRRRTSASLME